MVQARLTDSMVSDSRERAREPPTVRVSPDLPVCDDCLRRCSIPPIAGSIPVHQLYGLRPALLDLRVTVRPAADDDARLADVRRLAPGVRRSARPPLSRAARCVSPLRPVVFLTTTAQRSAATMRSRAAALLRDGDRARSAKVADIIWRATRAEAAAVAPARTKVSQGATLCAHGAQRSDAAELVDSRRSTTALAGRAAADRAAAQRLEFPGVAPENRDFGVMTAYTPLHHLLFAAALPTCSS